MKKIYRTKTLLFILFFSFLFYSSFEVRAASFTVNTSSDTVDINPGNTICADAMGACSLRAAMQESNALAGTNDITLPAGTYVLSLAGTGEDVAATGDLDFTGANLTITGAGAATTTIDANNLDRIFDVTAAVNNFTLSGLTLQGGGGILQTGSAVQYFGAGALTITNCVITGNGTAAFEGAVYSGRGNLNLSGTTFNSNTDNAIFVQNGGGVGTITNSTFSDNAAIAFRSAVGAGVTTINNSTFSGNTSNAISVAAATTVNIRNSIVANSTAANCSIAGTLNSLGNNIDSAASCGFIAAGDLSSTDPLLGSLTNNGGNTPTRALAINSPARDAGNNGTCAGTDQRGIVRPQNTVCDIGAFEGRLATATPSAASLTFADQVLATSSSAQSITLSNNGDFTLTIASIAVTDDYSQTNNCGVSLSVGATCTVNVTFTPTSVGAHNATLAVTHNGSGSPTNITLSGTGIRAATATPSSASLSFADQNVGTSSSSQTITLTNNGDVTLTISNIAVTDDFSQSNNCGGTILAGNSCTITVTFSPASSGAHSGTVTVSHDGSGGTTSVTLSGTALNPATATLSAASLSFGNQPINTSSAAQSVTVTNSGEVALTISDITISSPYSQTNDCNGSVVAGDTCILSVIFSPTSVGTQAGTAVITHNGTASPTTLTLSGTGIEGAASVNTQYQGDSAISCSLSEQNKSSANIQIYLWLFTFSILFFKRFFSKRNILFLFFFFTVTFSHLFSLWAFDASFTNEIFKPAADDSDYFTVYSSPVLKKSQYHFGMMFDYFHNPIQLGNSSNFSSISPINSNAMVVHAFGSYSPLNRLSVGGSFPFYLQNSIQVSGTDSSNMDLGDFEVFVKYNLLNRKKSKVGAKIGISIQAEGLIPTATNNKDHFTGSGSFGGGATVIVDSQVHSRVNVALNAGAEIKSSFTNIDGNKYGSQIKLGAAVAYDLVPKKLKLIAENQVESQLDNLFKRVSSPMEARLGIRYRFKQGVNLNLGGGMGYRAALASPEYRIFAGATFTSHRSDEFILPEAKEDEFMLDEKEWSELQLGDELKLKDKIFFDYNQSVIRPISKPTLSKLALFLNKHEEFKKLRVEGHTCDIGGKAYNLKLSQKRADEVRAYLVEQGVDENRLVSIGKGMEDPIVPNSDDYSREQNRRVSIFVEEKTQKTL